jgi:hypothetical protein
MSGGSLDYFYSRLEDCADSILGRSHRPKHIAFAQHLRRCATAAKDLEWEFSGDCGEGSADAAIDAVVTPQFEGIAVRDMVEEMVKQAQLTLERLDLKTEGPGKVEGS